MKTILLSLKTEFETDLAAAVARFAAPILEGDDATAQWARETTDAHLYPIVAGGKRVRPLLLRLTAASLGGEGALRLAKWPSLALECMHTYSLVHDDLPCMDNDDLRRGRPTTHKVFGDAKALLVGDGLLTMAFRCLAEIPSQSSTLTLKCLEQLSQAAGAQGMVLGQWMDLSAASANKVTWDDVATIHKLKTGELFAASFVLGAACAQHAKLQMTPIDFSRWASVGYQIGLAFQIIDDVLDATTSSVVLGKTAGKDAVQNKLTAVSLLGFDEAKALASRLSNDALVTLNELVGTGHDPYAALLKTTVESLLARRF